MKVKTFFLNRLQVLKLKIKTKGDLSGLTTVKGSDYIQINEGAVIGQNSKILCWDKYFFNQEMQSLHPSIQIGKNFRVTSDLTIQCGGNINIGDDVLMARNVFIIDYNHGIDPNSTNYLNNELQVESINIGNGVWIGNNVTILPGTCIGNKCIIGAGSVIKSKIEDYCMVAGNPAKVIKKYNYDLQKWIKV